MPLSFTRTRRLKVGTEAYAWFNMIVGDVKDPHGTSPRGLNDERRWLSQPVHGRSLPTPESLIPLTVGEDAQ
jgi:hypothetical protein